MLASSTRRWEAAEFGLLQVKVDLRRKDQFDKSVCKNIYRNCLLPVLSCYPMVR
jgi:hypothetical protein